MSADLLTSLDQQAGFIRFNRLAVRNAISKRMWLDIPLLMERLKSDGAKVIVFAGEGGLFASGADLEELRQLKTTADANELWSAIATCLEYIWRFDLPTIAMISGACIGGGCLLATSCDFRIATKMCTFAVPVSKFGLLIDDRTVARMVSAGGAPFAKEILMASQTVTAERALSLGYLLSTVEEEKLPSAVSELAQQLVNNVEASLRGFKDSINSASALPFNATSITEDAVIQSYLSDEFRNRVNST